MALWVGTPDWESGGVKLNPGAGVELVKTGSLAGRIYRVSLVISAPEAGFVAIFQQLDTEGTVIKRQALPVPLGLFWSPIIVVKAAIGDTLRLVTQEAVVGTLEASLFFG